MVVIEPGRAGRPPRPSRAGPSRHIRESPVALVAIKDIAPVARHIQVLPTIAVIIPGGHAHPESSASDPGLLRHVRKSAVVIITIERVPERFRGRIKIRWATVDEVDVHPPVVVIIEEGAA